MQQVHERVNPSYFALPTPRPFPSDALADLILDHLIRPGIRKILDPGVAIGVAIIVIVNLLDGPGSMVWIAVAFILLRLWAAVHRALVRIQDEIALLRHGLAVRAHVLGFHPVRNQQNELDGARLDCAIAVAPRRTYIGSIWLSDGTEAVAVAQRGRILVLCLPNAPGTWRVIEPLQSDIRYDRKAPLVRLPEVG